MTEQNTKRMSFLEHLEEFRWRLVKSLIAIVVGAVFTFLFIDQIIDFLIRPTRALGVPLELQVLKVQGMFMIKWGMSLVGGVILAIPVLTYQLWKFIVPGLYEQERKYVTPVILFTYLSFLVGIVFAYTVLIPFSLNFFTSIGVPDVRNNFSINYYFGFITWMMLGAGIVFELPIVVFILSLIGILTPAFMRHYRRFAMVVILILSAFITPPDPVSLIIMTVPLMGLYELSIAVSWMVHRGK